MALPGRFAETLDSCPPTGPLEKSFHSCPPTGPLDFFFTVVGLDDNHLDIFFLGRIPTSGRRAGQVVCARAEALNARQVARQECGALGIEASTLAGWRNSAGPLLTQVGLM